MNTIILLLVIGIIAGIIGGFAGVGGGLIIVPALVFIVGFSQHQAQGTSTATLLLPIGILAAYNYYKADMINWKYALIIAGGFVLGSFLGSKMAIELDPKLLKRAFSIILIVVAVRMMYDSFKN